MDDKQKRVVITGDITIDWNFARSRSSQRTGALWDPDFYMQGYPQAGGAALLGKLIAKVAEKADNGAAKVLFPDPPAEDRVPGTPPFWHSYTVCSQFPRTKKDWEDDSKWVWRVKEFWGLDRQPWDDNLHPPKLLLADDDGLADIIVVDAAYQGFHKLRQQIWPKSLTDPKDGSWLLLKLARPDFKEKDLFKHIIDRFSKRLIVVLTINDLRLKGMQISRALSWERTAMDLIREVSAIPELSHCVHCVVSMHTEGAVVFCDRDKTTKLYYDPRFLEGTWQSGYPGRMIGYNQCLVAGIVAQLMLTNNSDDIGPGVLSGLAAERDLQEYGLLAEGTRSFFPPPGFPVRLAFPIERIANIILKNLLPTEPAMKPPPFLSHSLPSSGRSDWNILAERYPDDDKVILLAENIVEWGQTEEEWDVPIGKFGKLLSINRAEIESLRAIGSLISEYIDSQALKIPLSIAVFGAPGAGKSFTIKAVAAELAPDGRIKELTFNLSQYTGPEAILNALHQVRDVALSGAVPLVFWDEFDTTLGMNELGWLRYFLAPMQDGTFQEGPLTHNIGRAVFVFAGGTRYTMGEFEKAARQQSRETKATDFLSRLKGYVDIPGLNHPGKTTDASVVLRRAILLRSILMDCAGELVQFTERPTRHDARSGQQVTPVEIPPLASQMRKRLNVDSGVLRAILRVKEYKYGARSMESIVKMSALKGKSTFERSSLPAEAQLGLHVNAGNFLRLVRDWDRKLRK